MKCSSRLVAVLAFFAAGVAANCAAAESCGVPGSTDKLFADNFQGDPAAPVQYLTTSRSVVGAAPTISITYPAPSQALPGFGTAVVGTFTGPADTGVVVNGVVAYTQGTTFFAVNVPIVAGSNTLRATATTLTGATAQSPAVVVTQTGALPPATLTAAAVTGFAPFKATFSPLVGSGVTANQVKVDYDGDGTDDITTTDASAPLTHSYSIPGLYVARLTLVDNTTTPNPTTYTAYRRILVQDVIEVRETLCSVYGYLRTTLASANVAQAVLVFDPDRRAHYQTFFGSISTANLPVAASRLGNIANGLISPDYAQLKVIKPFQGKTASFPMDFSRDDAGVWRIDSL